MARVAVGSAFSSANDGDMRSPADRTDTAESWGIPRGWATVTQVHGADVVHAEEPGDHGPADAVLTTRPGLPVAVLTADCLGIVLHGEGAVAAAHAGWRGIAAGVIEATVETMAAIGSAPISAVIGPSIGPCCYEVGPEVVAAVGSGATTTWGTPAVDLRAAARDRLEGACPGIDVTVDDRCTRCSPGFHSHRGDGTTRRQAAVGWL